VEHGNGAEAEKLRVALLGHHLLKESGEGASVLTLGKEAAFRETADASYPTRLSPSLWRCFTQQAHCAWVFISCRGAGKESGLAPGNAAGSLSPYLNKEILQNERGFVHCS
jgi:hypothetical protein